MHQSQNLQLQRAIQKINSRQLRPIPSTEQPVINLLGHQTQKPNIHHPNYNQIQQPPQSALQSINSGLPSTKGIPIEPIVIDSSQAMKFNMGVTMFKERGLMARNDIWHKIKIHHGGKYDKDFVLKNILQVVNPADLIPVKYQVVGDDSFFIARNCDRALDQLCKCNLIIKCSDGTPLILSITLGFASIHDLKINIQPLLLAALQRRHDPEKKTIMLDEFHKDPEIYKTVYCPLSQTRTFAHVLKLIKTAFTVEHLSLRNNELTYVTVLETSGIKTIKCLDLRNNDILKIQALDCLKTLEIREVYLDGNPLCENYSSSRQYVESVRKCFPKLIKLDGIQISPIGYPLCFKSYIKNWKKVELVEQFVTHFFTAYDCKDRSVLLGLYSDDSWYSTTVGTPTNPKSKKYLQPFGTENRNLMIFGKGSQQLYHGPDEILNVFKKLPASQHIHKSFCCDLIFDSENILVLSVEGLFKFRDVDNQICFFNRTFVLNAEEDDEYKIINDQYHVYLPTRGLDNISSSGVEDDEPLKFKPIYLSNSDKETLVVTLQEATTMNNDSCRRYMEDACWDLRKAILTFMDNYKNGRVLKEAF